MGIKKNEAKIVMCMVKIKSVMLALFVM